MTEGDKAFCKRRIREELLKAEAPENRHIRHLHLRWALLYQERMDGTPKNVTRVLEAQLKRDGIALEALPDVGGRAV
jgi:hypothetical protein